MKKCVCGLFLAAAIISVSFCGCSSNNGSINNSEKPVPSSSYVSGATSKAPASNGEIAGSGIKKTYALKKAASDGCVAFEWSADGGAAKCAAYNIAKLDEFIKDTQSGKSQKIRIIQYQLQGSKQIINKLDDISYDGKTYLDKGYDTYTDQGSSSSSFAKMVKTVNGGTVSYKALQKGNSSASGSTILAFPSASVKN